MEEPQTYSTREVAMLAGVSYRQLDYWIRVGTVKPRGESMLPGSGHYRQFTPEDVDVLLAVIGRWRDAEKIVVAFRRGQLWDETEPVKGHT